MIRPPPRSTPFPYTTLFRSTVALLLTLLLGIPVLAQMGLLKCFVPYEVNQYPTQLALGLPFEPITAPSLASLKKAVGFPLLVRSEEHTSELQSRLHLVCRLL